MRLRSDSAMRMRTPKLSLPSIRASCFLSWGEVVFDLGGAVKICTAHGSSGNCGGTSLLLEVSSSALVW